MLDQITMISKTQMVVIEPNTRSVQVIDAGPQGPIDPDLSGDPGIDADSAYEIAQDYGFVGTETQWLASLSGVGAIENPTAIGGLHVNSVLPLIDAIGGVNVTDL